MTETLLIHFKNRGNICHDKMYDHMGSSTVFDRGGGGMVRLLGGGAQGGDRVSKGGGENCA